MKHMPMDAELRRRIVERAIEMYHEPGSVEVDSSAKVSANGTGGHYVQAWVWVPEEDRLGGKVAE